MSHEQTETETQAQRRGGEIVRMLDEVRAPASLHEAIARMTASAPATRSPWRAIRLRPAAAGAFALLAAATVAVVLALSGGGPAAPTVLQAATLTGRPATLRAPDEDPSRPGELTISAGGIAYPYWGHRFGWQTAGARTDRLRGRAVTTVFYTNAAARRIGYSIVDGRTLATPSAGRSTRWHGVRFQVLDAAGRTVVTWQRARGSAQRRC
jgi:hypothetical protein